MPKTNGLFDKHAGGNWVAQVYYNYHKRPTCSNYCYYHYKYITSSNWVAQVSGEAFQLYPQIVCAPPPTPLTTSVRQGCQ